MTNPKHFPQLVRGAALGALLTFTHAALAANPAIAGASPNSASGQLTITGSGFLPASGAPAVRLDTLPLTVLPGYSDSQIVATLPANISAGTYLLIVVAGGGAGTFNVTIPPRFLPFSGTVAASSAAGLAVTNSTGTGIEGFGVGGYGVVALGGASGGNGVAGVFALGGGGGGSLGQNVANGGAGVSAEGAGGNVQGGDGVDATGGMGGMGGIYGNHSGNGVSATGGNSSNPGGFSGNGVYAVGGNGSWGGAGVYAVGGTATGGCSISNTVWPPWYVGTSSPSNTCSGPGVYGQGSAGTATSVVSVGGIFFGFSGLVQGPSDGIDVFGMGAVGIYAPQTDTSLSAALFDGNAFITGNLSKGGGSFQIDHPLDPANQYLYHSFAESPDMKNIYDGTLTTDGAGHATVLLPDWFEVLNRDFRYHLTAIGQPAHAWIASRITHNTFTIRTDKPNVEVCWQVTGIRQDAWANAHRIPVEVEKVKSEQGHYLYPELFRHAGEPSITRLHHPLPTGARAE